MQPEHTEIRFLQVAIEKHRRNLYTLELQAIDYGLLGIPLQLHNATIREQEQLALREQRLEILLAATGTAGMPAALNADDAPRLESPTPAAAQSAGASLHVGEGARLTGVSMVVGSHIAGDFSQTMQWGS
ncbi:MAG TPA: hypothetical protein VGE07_18405 [Herpetosiphonaceae bacterium]